MTITSIQFGVFAAVVIGLYYFLPRRGQNLLLLIASYVFLVSWNWTFAVVYLLLTGVNYILAPMVGGKKARGRLALLGGILLNIGALAFFKYANFFLPSAVGLLQAIGIRSELGSLQILLPVGLSFAVVQAISYLMDAWAGVNKGASGFVDFALYMAFFPRVIAGPIERARVFLPQLQQKRTFRTAKISDHLIVFIQGLIRKMVIADLLFLILPQQVFQSPLRYSAVELAVWLLAFTFALYNDFAGYSMMARGIAGCLGLSLTNNFEVPYFSRNFSELWRRWHISLSMWLRDYIFMPSVRSLLKMKFSRDHLFSIVIPPMLTMLVSALWHGVGVGMFLWGFLHGLFLVIERVMQLSRPGQPIQKQAVWRQFLSAGGVFVLVALTWVPFRADLAPTLQYWGKLLSPSEWISALGTPQILQYQILNRLTLDVVGLVGLSLILDVIQYRFGELAVAKLPIPVQAVVINLVFFALIFASMAQNVPPPFVYQGF